MIEDNNEDPLRLLKIKSHIGFHGFGCAIVDDHVVVSLTEGGGDCPCQKITRVKSFDEACRVIGCHCSEAE